MSVTPHSPGGRRQIDDELISAIREIGEIKSQVGSVSIALFGHPSLRQDGGIVGEIKDLQRVSDSIEEKLTRLYHATLSLTITLIGTAVTIALTVH